MDPAKVRPMGPWLLIEIVKNPSVLQSGLYIPDGNTMERLGYQEGKVLRVGDGLPNTGKYAKTKYTPHDLKTGDRVVFRGHLKSANTLSQLDDNHCLLHVQDVVGVLAEGAKLDLALPYDN